MLFTTIVALPPFTLSLLLKDIQQIMKYFSSIFGYFLMIVFPSLIILYARKKVEKNNVEPGKINKSIFEKNYYVTILNIISLSLFGLIIYGFFTNISKKCVSEGLVDQ